MSSDPSATRRDNQEYSYDEVRNITNMNIEEAIEFIKEWEGELRFSGFPLAGEE